MRGVEGAEGAAPESSDVVRPGTRPVRTTDEAVPGALGVGDGRVGHRGGARRGELAREQCPGGRVEQLVGLLLVGDVVRLDALDHVTVQIGHLPGARCGRGRGGGIVRVTGRTTASHRHSHCWPSSLCVSPCAAAEWSRASGAAMSADVSPSTATTATTRVATRAEPAYRRREQGRGEHDGERLHHHRQCRRRRSRSRRDPACSPNGSPQIRLTAHAPMEAALTAMIVKMTARVGRSSTATASAICSHAATRNPMPSTVDSPKCDGAEREVHGAGADEQRGDEPLHPPDARRPGGRLRWPSR